MPGILVIFLFFLSLLFFLKKRVSVVFFPLFSIFFLFLEEIVLIIFLKVGISSLQVRFFFGRECVVVMECGFVIVSELNLSRFWKVFVLVNTLVL